MKEFFKVVLYQPLFNLFILCVALVPNHNAGLAIILLTLLIRLLLLPVRRKAIASQLIQRELQPELKRLQEKYKGDRQALSLATMQMYKDKGANPASGCLPALVQITMLIALYSVFRLGWGPDQQAVLYSFVTLPQDIDASFFWLKDITKIDHTFIFPIGAGIAQFFYSRSLLASMPQPTRSGKGDAEDMAHIMSKQMMYLGPAMTVLIGRTLPAALSLYWLVGTLIDWYQQVRLAKQFEASAQTNKVSVSVRTKRKEI